MPELPEVESVRKHIAPGMEHARFTEVVLRRRDLREPFPRRFRERLVGESVIAVERRAKYLVVPLSSGETLLMHLGMSGSFRVGDAGTMAHDHVVFHMSSGAVVTFNDPRRFGLMDLVPADKLAAHPALSAMGPEPLSAAFDASLWHGRAEGRGRRSRPRCSISVSSPASATSTRARRCTSPVCHRTGRPPPSRRRRGCRVRLRIGSRLRSRKCSRTLSRARRDATIDRRGSACTTARRSAAGAGGAPGRSGAGRKRGDRRSSALRVSAERNGDLLPRRSDNEIV